MICRVILPGVLLVAWGCAQIHPPTTEREDPGLVWLLPGIEGGPLTLQLAYKGMRDAGVTAEVRIYDWERPLGLSLIHI